MTVCNWAWSENNPVVVHDIKVDVLQVEVASFRLHLVQYHQVALVVELVEVKLVLFHSLVTRG
jgi:hypothetical protein